MKGLSGLDRQLSQLSGSTICSSQALCFDENFSYVALVHNSRDCKKTDVRSLRYYSQNINESFLKRNCISFYDLFTLTMKVELNLLP